MALSNVDVHAVVEQFQFRHHPHFARGLFVPNQLLRRLDGHHLDALCRVGRVCRGQRHRSVVRAVFVVDVGGTRCVTFSSLSVHFQYRPHDEQTGSDHFER